MNKTVTANISGIVFHIEVEAYEKLNAYLNKIRSYFKNSPDSEEIMADIEARIAELLSPKIKTGNQVILDKDIEEVMTIMGKPEQYIQEEDEAPGQQQKTNAQAKSKQTKKLFRDPDDRVLGGVASGLGNYFGIDPVWIRLIFVVMFFVGTGGFWIYVILWIVIPEAKTAADKLKMRGETVNIENIGRAFEEGAQKVNQKIKDIDAKGFGEKAERAFASFFHVLITILKGVIKAVGKILGIIILVLGILLAAGMLGWVGSESMIFSLTSDGVFAVESREFFSSIFNTAQQYHIFKIGIILLLAIPVLALIYGGIKLLFGYKGRTGIGMGLGIIWLVALGLCLIVGLQLAADFKSDSKVTEYVAIEPSDHVFTIKLSEEMVPGTELLLSTDDDFLLHMDKANIYYGYPTLNIERSYKDSVLLKVQKMSQGRSKKQSLGNAQGIAYRMQQKGDLLLFDSYLTFDKAQKIRGQKVKLTLLIPVGTIIYLDENVEDLIHDIDNVSHTWDRDMLGKKWIMKEEGLTCLDCAEIEGANSEDFEEGDWN